jgi:hypothetical protein
MIKVILTVVFLLNGVPTTTTETFNADYRAWAMDACIDRADEYRRFHGGNLTFVACNAMQKKGEFK